MPIDTADAHARLKTLEREAFATVVRLPLKTETASELVKAAIAQLPSDTILFLDRACSLTLDCDGERRQLTRRATRDHGSKFGRQTVTISTGGESQPESYITWERKLEVSEQSEEFRNSVANLPGKWPELREARISLAVRTGEVPAHGVFSIFLPRGSPKSGHVGSLQNRPC
jgi:hypothetical protein